MNTLQGIFDNGRSTSKRNFIQENVRQLRTLQKSWNKKEKNVEQPPKLNKYQHITAKVPAHITASVTSKQKDASSAQVFERTRNGVLLTRSSLSSGLSAAHSAGIPHSRSSTRILSKAMPARKSQIYPFSADNQSRTLERDFSNKSVNNGSVFPGKKAKSISKSLSVMTLSGSEVPKESSDMGHRAVSENSITVEPVRSLGCQTVPPGDEEGMFNEGVIKYPSTCYLGVIQTESSCKAGRPPTCDSAQQTEIYSRLSSQVSSANATRPNSVPQDNVIPMSSKQQEIKISPPAHERLLQRFKDMSMGGGKNQLSNMTNLKRNSPKKGRNREKIADILQNQASDFDKPPTQVPTSDPSCPEGHAPLPEAERLETLRILQKSYEDHIRQLNSLPVKTDTLRMRLRKIDIEKQLSKLEEGIKVFSRPKVFVKIEA